jgi:hypothetical protein
VLYDFSNCESGGGYDSCAFADLRFFLRRISCRVRFRGGVSFLDAFCYALNRYVAKLHLRHALEASGKDVLRRVVR